MDAIGGRAGFLKDNLSDRLRKIAARALPLGLGLLLSRAGLFGGVLSPFGAGFVAACGRGDIGFALAGVIIGYVLPGSGTDLLRYIATALAVAGIKWALAEFRQASGHPAFSPCAALAGVILTGVVVTTSAGAMLGFSLLLFAAEGMLAAAGAHFFAGGLRYIGGIGARNFNPHRSSPRKGDAVSMLVLVSCAAISLCGITVAGFSPGNALVIAALLLAARGRGAVGGAVGGIAAGAVIALATGGFALAGITACAGLVAGLFAGLGGKSGRIFSGISFMLVTGIGSIGSGAVNVFFITEAMAGMIIASLIPSGRIEEILSLAGVADIGYDIRSAPSVNPTGAWLRLSDAARALAGVSETMEAISGKLDGITRIPPETICRQAAREICHGCGHLSNCWGGERRTATESDFNSIPSILEKDGRLDGRNAPESVGKNCAKSGEMTDKINGMYSDYCARSGARRRLAQMRAVVADQLGGVGDLLTELAGETHAAETPDRGLCALAAEVFRDAGYAADSVVCAKSASGGLTVAAVISGREKKSAPRTAIPGELGGAMGILLGETRWERQPNGDIVAEYGEIPPLKVMCGAAQRTRGNERLCGDSYEMFLAGGRAGLLISDGMGTGGRAAVDSAMTCSLLTRLLKAGFSTPGACKIVNASLLVKSDDESLSTVDCARVNLFTGEAEICKAGAAVSFLRQGGQVREVDIPSLPLGILRKTDLGILNLNLDPGDILVMASDGAAAHSERIISALRGYDGFAPKEFARFLADDAAARNDEPDDVTVLVMMVEENETTPPLA